MFVVTNTYYNVDIYIYIRTTSVLLNCYYYLNLLTYDVYLYITIHYVSDGALSGFYTVVRAQFS